MLSDTEVEPLVSLYHVFDIADASLIVLAVIVWENSGELKASNSHVWLPMEETKSRSNI